MREIVFDTETTGTDHENGDRMVEIGCIEMIDRVMTGRTYHCYFNPDRAMDPGAERVHGGCEGGRRGEVEGPAGEKVAARGGGAADGGDRGGCRGGGGSRRGFHEEREERRRGEGVVGGRRDVRAFD